MQKEMHNLHEKFYAKCSAQHPSQTSCSTMVSNSFLYHPQTHDQYLQPPGPKIPFQSLFYVYRTVIITVCPLILKIFAGAVCSCFWSRKGCAGLVVGMSWSQSITWRIYCLKNPEGPSQTHGIEAPEEPERLHL